MNQPSSPKVPTPTNPVPLGRYDLLELVGTGGIGQVFRARHRESGEIVALKRLHDCYQNDKKLLGLFHKEIMIHSRVSHRHCVRFIEADLTPGSAHIVTTFVDGYNCYNLVKQMGPIPPIVACSIVLDLLLGLEHLHCLDIVHSDLTPSNVLVARNGLTLLADFGLSCLNEVEDYAGLIVGTPGYQAPERITHEPITPVADIYGVGILFYEMLRGERLYYGYQEKELADRMRKIDLDWIQTPDKRLNRFLRETLALALAFNPNRRFQAPRDFMYAIYSSLKLAGITHTRRAILQWMVDTNLTDQPPNPPIQNIYFGTRKGRPR